MYAYIYIYILIYLKQMYVITQPGAAIMLGNQTFAKHFGSYTPLTIHLPLR